VRFPINLSTTPRLRGGPAAEAEPGRKRGIQEGMAMKEKPIDYFVALYDLARVINASLDPCVVLEQVAQHVALTIRAKACSIRLLDSRKQRLLLRAAYGLSDKYLRKGPVLVKESGLDKKALQGKTMWLRDASTDKNFQYGARAKAEGIKSVLVLPLLIDNKATGVLRVYSDKVREFDDQEIRFLEAAANLSAIAIENARLHKTLQNRYELMTEHKNRIDDN